jgi:signal transduction histidine kinase
MADEREPLAVLAHDLRSPVAVIEMYAGVIERDAEGRLTPEQRVEYARRIRAAAADMRDLVDQAASGTASRRPK